MEGGAPEEDLSDVLPPYGNGGTPQPSHAHAADDGEDDMLWDYGGSSASRSALPAAAQPPPPPAPPASTPWSNIMATAKSAMASSAPSAAQVAALGGGPPAQPRSGSAAAAAAAKPASGWASAVGGARAGVRPAAQPSQQLGNSAQASQQRPAQQASPSQPAQQASSAQGPPLMAGDVVLSSEFQGWCRNEMLRFFGHTDLSLVEVLVTLPSRSEVADYCSMFMEGKPGGWRCCGAFICFWGQKTGGPIRD